MKDKLMSRKFILSLAAFLASIATSISGIATENQTVIVIGVICSVLSAALYAFAEAYVDGKAVTFKAGFVQPETYCIGFQQNSEDSEEEKEEEEE